MTSLFALNALNFFMADVQTGFGSFVSFYLAGLGWSVADVGLVLSHEQRVSRRTDEC